MDEQYFTFFPLTDQGPKSKGVQHARFDLSLCVADRRVSRLLGVLQELDQEVEGLEHLQRHDLVNLVSSAIHSCGFAGPDDARYAIAAVLKAIEAPDASDWS